MGISKRELLTEYYMDEFCAVSDEWRIMHGTAEVEEDVSVGSAQAMIDFLGG